MSRSHALQVAFLVLLAFGLRFHDLGRPASRWQDENNNMEGAVHYWTDGQFEPDTWEHPPLRALSAYAFLSVLGDNPHGWRMRNVLLGTAAVALVWLFGTLVGGARVGFLAGGLLATDPLHVVLSRFTFEEVYGGALFLAAVVVFVKARHRTWGLVAAAFLLGGALATKWYYVPAWLLMFGLLVWEHRGFRSPGRVAFLAAHWFLIPIGLYVAAYWPWFSRGYTLGELPEFTANAYAHLQSMSSSYVDVVDQRQVFQGHRSALEWFLSPIWIGDGLRLSADRAVFLIYSNDLPVWGLTLPAVVATSVFAWRNRRPEWGLPALFFVPLYALFLPVQRPAFLYSAAPLLPFAFTAIALLLVRITEHLRARVFWGVVAVALAWNLYLYPLVAAKPVSLAPYRWLLEEAEIIEH